MLLFAIPLMVLTNNSQGKNLIRKNKNVNEWPPYLICITLHNTIK